MVSVISNRSSIGIRRAVMDSLVVAYSDRGWYDKRTR